MNKTATKIWKNSRINRRLKVEVIVATAEEEGLDDEGGKWVTICLTHGAIMNSATKSEAYYLSLYPDELCEECMKLPTVFTTKN